MSESTPPTSRLIVPGQTPPPSEDGAVTGLTCQRCGGPLPALDGELAALARRAGGVSLVHAEGGCVGDAPAKPEGRYFEVRVKVVEVVEMEHDPTVSAEPEVVTEEMFSFVAGVRTPDLEAAMRPLAESLGTKWLEAEKHARIADPRAGGVV